MLNLGIIGLDTTHAVEFTRILQGDPYRGRIGVTAAYPWGSGRIESSLARLPRHRQQIQELGVPETDSIAELIERVDGVLLETNDGNLHLPQALEVFRSGLPVFIDKPFAATLPDVIALFDLAEAYGVRLFSASALRYAGGVQAARLGEPTGCDTFGPCPVESTHSDLFWYGIHGIEMLLTVLGTGCRTVTHHGGGHSTIVVCEWGDARIGTYRGSRDAPPIHGGSAHLPDGPLRLGGFEGFDELVQHIAAFFLDQTQPVSWNETREIYTVMEAARASRIDGGKTTLVAEVAARAETAAGKIIARASAVAADSQTEKTSKGASA